MPKGPSTAHWDELPQTRSMFVDAVDGIEKIIGDVLAKAITPIREKLEESEAAAAALRIEIDEKWRPDCARLAATLKLKTDELEHLKLELSQKDDNIKRLKEQLEFPCSSSEMFSLHTHTSDTVFSEVESHMSIGDINRPDIELVDQYLQNAPDDSYDSKSRSPTPKLSSGTSLFQNSISSVTHMKTREHTISLSPTPLFDEGSSDTEMSENPTDGSIHHLYFGSRLSPPPGFPKLKSFVPGGRNLMATLKFRDKEMDQVEVIVQHCDLPFQQYEHYL